MDQANKVALRMVGITMVLVLLGVAKVNTGFNRIVQPMNPVTLMELRTELNSRIKALPIAELNSTIAELNSRIRGLPLQQVKSDILEVGLESRQQLLFWWEGIVKPQGNNVASKKR